MNTLGDMSRDFKMSLGWAKEGHRAYQEGVDRDDCPYRAGSLPAQTWEDAWDEAALDERAAREEGEDDD